MSAALRVVADAEGAAVVHCAAGKDRTGTVVAMALDVAGVPREEIVADYVLTAERIEQIIGRLMPRAGLRRGAGEADARRAAAAGRVDRGHPRRRGRGVGRAAEGWLRDQGWSEAEVERLRAQAHRAGFSLT